MSDELPIPPESPDVESVGTPFDTDPNNSTIRVLIYDMWFRIAAALFVLVFIFLALFLPKIWRTTPADFLPIIKVSGLDKVQAWSLRRSAEKLGAEGRFEEALLAWQSAVGNNQGDPELIRGSLRALLAQPTPSKSAVGYGVGRCFWLLRLTGTNVTDLGLTVNFLHHCDLDDMALELVGKGASALPMTAQADMLAVYFNQGRMDLFGELWKSGQANFTNSTVLRVYQTAWQAAWGPPVTLQSSRSALSAAQTSSDPATALLAHRLQLPVSGSLNDLEGFQRSLTWLKEHHADRPGDHVHQWQLLINSGRRQEAQDLARAFSQPPENASEASGMASIFLGIGLEDYGLEFLTRQLRDYGYYSRLWVLLAQHHIRSKHWPELRALAVEMRSNGSLRGQLDGYSQFIAGLSDQKLGRTETAAVSFSKVLGSQFDDSSLAYSVASELLRLGYADLSSKMLQKLESEYGSKASFWFELTSAAYEARDMDTVNLAARKAWELEPTRIDLINNYAAVLIVLRQKPEESVKLTLNLISRQPDRAEFRINHILALLQNRRLVEAELLLKAINPNQITLNESAVIAYAQLELCLQRGDRAGARKLYPTIQRSELLQPQLDWMDAEFKKLDSAPAK
jgi:tetratricopeptide (TPR) repeat protein